MNFNFTFIGQSISFLVFVWVTKTYIWPLFAAILEERKKRIADGLEAAARAGKDLELAKSGKD